MEWYYGMNCDPSPHSYTEVLAPQYLKMCSYLEIRPLKIFRTLMRPLGGPHLIWLVSFLIWRGNLDTQTQKEDHGKTGKSHLQAKENSLLWTITLLTHWSWTSKPSELWGNELLLFKPPSLLYFVMAALTN